MKVVSPFGKSQTVKSNGLGPARLRGQEMPVSELAQRLGVAIGNLSQHLDMMKQRRVLASRKEANNVYYRLANPKVLRALDLMREILLEQMGRESVVVRKLERAQARP